MGKPTILVATGSGSVAPAVVRALVKRPGIQVRVGLHDTSKTADLDYGDVEVVEFDFDDDDPMRTALDGVDKVCLITPGLKGYHIEEAKRFVEMAGEAGVQHIVRISIVWAADQSVTFGRWHRDIERFIETSGVPWTILRPQPLMENFVMYTPPDATGSIYMPVGDGATAYVSAVDVGLTAAAVLAGDSDGGQTYLLSGPTSITTSDVADAIGRATGRSIQYVDVPAQMARQGMEGAGVPMWLIEGQLECYASMKRGETVEVTDAVARLTGERPRTIDQFAEEHVGAWR